MRKKFTPSLNKALQSAEALKESLKCSSGDARHILAGMLGYIGWDHFADQVEINDNSPMDSKLSNDLIDNRIGTMADNLQLQLDDVPRNAIELLVESINPFKQDQPTPYRVEIFKNKTSKDSVSLQDLLDFAGGKDGMEEFFHNMMEHEDLAGLKDKFGSFDEMQEAMRFSLPVDPHSAANVASIYLDWNVDEFSFDQCEFTDMPMYAIEEDGVEILVICVRPAITPGESYDELYEDLKKLLMEGYGNNVIVQFGFAVFKEIDGKVYSVIGQYFRDGKWNWLMLSKSSPRTQSNFKELNVSNNYDLESPCPSESLSSTIELANQYTSVLQGSFEVVDDEKVKVTPLSTTMVNQSGWNMFFC